MPNSKSASKRLRQNVTCRDRNRATKSVVRGHLKKVRTAIESGDVALCETEFKTATKKLDQAAANGLFHANKTARTKSRLSKAIKELKSK